MGKVLYANLGQNDITYNTATKIVESYRYATSKSGNISAVTLAFTLSHVGPAVLLVYRYNYVPGDTATKNLTLTRDGVNVPLTSGKCLYDYFPSWDIRTTIYSYFFQGSPGNHTLRWGVNTNVGSALELRCDVMLLG